MEPRSVNVFDPPPLRIAVFRALQLGDLLCAVPALRALRAAAPQAHVTLIGLRGAADFVRRFRHLLDDLLVFPGRTGFPEQTARTGEWAGFIAAARARSFDLAIQLHGSGELSNAVVMQLGARRGAGFRPTNEHAQAAALTETFIPWTGAQPEVLRWLALMHFLGAPDRGASLELPIDDAERTAACALAAHHRLEADRFVCIHPGARLPSRRWPVERFALVGHRLAGEGWRIAVTGSAEERALTGSLAAALRRAGIDVADLTGQTSLGTLATILSRCRLVVSNDTGVSHVAAAVRARSVIVACGSDVQRWRPLDRDRHRVLAHDVACRPCSHADCPIGHPCALGVTADAVLSEARLQLHETRPREIENAA
jgi:ADP-heptose:LPS heptosyltransferase